MTGNWTDDRHGFRKSLGKYYFKYNQNEEPFTYIHKLLF